MATDPNRIKKFMFVNRKAPYGTIYALESLEVVLITATFDQDVSLVFLDDGVYELVKGQNTKAIGIKNFSPTYRALDGYDVEKLYVERESLEARGLTRRPVAGRRRGAEQRADGRADGATGRGAELLRNRTMLHIVNKSPSQTRTLDSCLRLAQDGSAVLLIEDGVYAATRGNADAAALHAGLRPAAGVRAAARLRRARHAPRSLADGITLVDYGGFVDLVAQHKTTHSWL